MCKLQNRGFKFLSPRNYNQDPIDFFDGFVATEFAVYNLSCQSFGFSFNTFAAVGADPRPLGLTRRTFDADPRRF